MRTFTDTANRVWTVAVNVDAIKRVKALAGVDLLAAAESDLAARLANDPVLLVGVLYALCKPEMEARKVDDEDFGRAMAGDAIDAASTALLEDLIDFFPKARRDLLRRAIMKISEVQAAVTARAAERIDALDAEKLLREISGESSGSSQESPAFTPARLRSAS